MPSKRYHSLSFIFLFLFFFCTLVFVSADRLNGVLVPSRRAAGKHVSHGDG